MAAAHHHPHNPSGDRDEQRAHKKIRRNCECRPRLAHAAKIENGNHDQNSHAQRNRVRQQRRNRRNQRAHSRGNTHRGRQDVIREQRRGRQQSRRRAQVKPRHRIGAATRGIRGDGLPVGKIYDHQQRDNGRANRDDIVNAQQPQRNQKAERRFRPVRGRTQRVEAKNRNPLHRTDLLGAFVAGRDRFPNYEIKNVHRRSCPAVGSHNKRSAHGHPRYHPRAVQSKTAPAIFNGTNPAQPAQT